MEKNKDYDKIFRDNNVDLISGRDINKTGESHKEFGLFKIAENGKTINMAMPVRHWGKLYEEIIRSVLCGGYKNDDSVVGTQALNYYWGMSSGAVDVIYSRNLPPGAIRMLRTLREGIKNMDINPFTGPIYSQDGMCMCEDGNVLPPEYSVNMDWLVENVEGYIPDVDDLKDEALELVKLQGVRASGI